MHQLNSEIQTDDAALFRAAVGKITPIKAHNRIEPIKHHGQCHVRHHKTPLWVADVLSDHAAAEAPIEYLSNGLARNALRKLRSNPIQDKLDLHGLTSDSARQLLQQFIHHASNNNLRTVLVVHGKGMNSHNGKGVLRDLTRHWLRQHHKVLAYCRAPDQHGGDGAALILLKIRN